MLRFNRRYLEFERCSIVDDGTAFEADVLAHCGSLLLFIARVAQRPTGILEEALVGEHVMTQLALEAAWVPVGVHCLDDTA